MIVSGEGKKLIIREVKNEWVWILKSQLPTWNLGLQLVASCYVPRVLEKE